MNILRSNLNKYQRSKKSLSDKVTKLIANTKALKFQVIDGLDDIDHSIFCGICECIEQLENGHIRTGIFVLGRTIEEISTLFIEKSLEKGKRIGITKPQYNKHKTDFTFYKRLEFLAGEEVNLYKKVNIKFKKQPLINAGRKSSLHEIREYGRNKGAHPVTTAEFLIIKDNLSTWLVLGLDFIIDIQVELTRQKLV